MSGRIGVMAIGQLGKEFPKGRPKIAHRFIYGYERNEEIVIVPLGTNEKCECQHNSWRKKSFVLTGLIFFSISYPGINSWAIFNSPFGTG